MKELPHNPLGEPSMIGSFCVRHSSRSLVFSGIFVKRSTAGLDVIESFPYLRLKKVTFCPLVPRLYEDESFVLRIVGHKFGCRAQMPLK
jgi:hypothetical protein